jgi:anti-anti-sigma factor
LWEQLSTQDREADLRLRLETLMTEETTVICCTGRIAYGIAGLSEKITELLPQTRQLVIDLSGVEMIDAAGLGELVSIAVMAQTSDCSIKLTAPSDFVRQLLELTNLISVFEVHSTVNAAKLAFREQTSLASAGL